MTNIYENEIQQLTALKKAFFRKQASTIAQSLLGRVLVRSTPQENSLYGIISETIAFEGENKASNKGILQPAGIYNITNRRGHYVLDITTNKEGISSCVTISGLRTPVGDVIGPGNVTKYLHIDDLFDGVSIGSKDLWIGGDAIDPEEIMKRNKSNLPPNCKGVFYIK